jgi:hypothetical protein
VAGAVTASGVFLPLEALMNRRIAAAGVVAMFAACGVQQRDLALDDDGGGTALRPPQTGSRLGDWPSPGSLTLSAGTRIGATWGSEVTSGSNKVGETVALSVARDVEDAHGRVVIPAGSTIYLLITRFLPASSISGAHGEFSVSVRSATIRGQSYDLWGYVTSVPYSPQGLEVVSGAGVQPGGGPAEGIRVSRSAGDASTQAASRVVVVDAGAPVAITLSRALTVWVR